MKKIILNISVMALIGLTSVSFTSRGGDDNLTIKKDLSSVEWIGKKVSGQHSGTINIKEGSLHMHENQISNGTIVIDMSSIAVTDMEGGMKTKLEGHLNSPDFFDVANNKTATLKITSSKKIDNKKHTISGELTIKGITKPIEFPATIELKEGKLAAYAELSVDRTLYDIKYGSGKFFEGLGDKMIKDEFIIKFKIAAAK
jgi:polyisoprenoid-binding protein YceI